MDQRINIIKKINSENFGLMSYQFKPKPAQNQYVVVTMRYTCDFNVWMSRAE